MIFSRPVCPRASRTALIAASVPELTTRTCSIEGTRSQIRRAKSTSSSVFAPKLVPPRAVSATRARTRSGAWPRISGPQEQT